MINVEALSYKNKSLLLLFSLATFPILLVLYDVIKYEIVKVDLLFYVLLDNISILLGFFLGIRYAIKPRLRIVEFKNATIILFLVLALTIYHAHLCLPNNNPELITRTLWIACLSKDFLGLFYPFLYQILFLIAVFCAENFIKDNQIKISLPQKILLLISILLPVAIITIQGNRIELIWVTVVVYMATSFKIFSKVILLIFVLIISASFVRGAGEGHNLLSNIYDTFLGGPVLLARNYDVIITNKDYLIFRPFSGLFPGFFTATSTLVDQLFGTKLAYQHFDSVFYKIHDWFFVGELNIKMNSYFTGAVSNLIVGSFNTALQLAFLSFISGRYINDIKGRVIFSYLCMYCFSWTMYNYFQSIAASTSAVTLIAICIRNEFVLLKKGILYD